MNNFKSLLDSTRAYINRNDYKLACRELEKLLMLLKADYEGGVNKVKSGRAFNKLLPVRKELISGHLTRLTYEALGMEVPASLASVKMEPTKEPEPVKEELPDISSSSDFFDNLDFGDEKEEENPVPKEAPKEEEKPEDAQTAEEKVLEQGTGISEFQFQWDEIPTVKFEDIAGLDDVKELVGVKVLMPLLHPDAFEGYVTTGGGGLCLYGPPGTGKTMMAAAIANKINAKFCTVTPSDLLHQGAGNTEKAVRALFQQARSFKCAVIFFDEMDSIAPKSTKSQYARQLRSELLAQLQGISSYGKKKDNILFLICATNKPWDIDSAFLRPGRFGTKVYVTLPDDEARTYMVNHRLDKIRELGIVTVDDDIDVPYIVEKIKGYNCADITNLLQQVEEISVTRAYKNPMDKHISMDDFKAALKVIPSTVQMDDIIKLNEWRKLNDVVGMSVKEEMPDEKDDDPKGPDLPPVDANDESNSSQNEEMKDSKNDFFDSLDSDDPSDNNK